MRKVLKFVKGRRDDKKDHGSSSRALGPFSDLPSPVDQITPTDEHGPGFENAFGYHVDLSGKDKTVTKLHKAAWQGNLEKLKVNMKKIDIDVIDRNNRTPLHLAAAQGHANIIWFLLGNKANMNICDKEGKTPFLKAIECGHKETIQIMLERGVDINTIDYSGNSGLHIAAKHGFYEIASMLLKQGANFESSNNFGEFPLHIATVAENKDLVELLLRYGSSVNIVDRDNRSPLMFAAKLGSMALVQLFLEYGAQRAVMDSNDWTAEDYALMGGHQDVAAELKSPSERMVMSYTDKSADTPGRAISIVTGAKRSISEASLPPEPQEKEKEDTIGASKHSEDADNSDTWNDSQLSDSSLKQKSGGLKLSKFLPPSSDDEISEESIQSPQVQEMKDEEIQDSPRSCVIPPPCKPPRSWDLIQSGVIDDPKVLEPRRRSLLPLGSLRSRRESFNESPSGAESSSFHDDSPHQGQGDADQWLGSQSFRKSDDKRDSLTRRHLNISENEGSKDSPSTKYEDIQLKSAHGKDDSTQQKEKKNGSTIGGGGDAATLSDVKGKESLKGSSSESDWDSDDSLPLDNYPPVANVTISPADDTNSPLKVFRVVKPNELDVPENADGFREGSPYSLNSEKRGRFLMRAPSIDLTDDDTETGKNKHSHSSASSDLAKLASENKDGSESDKNHSVAGTLGRDGTLRGYEEVWEANAHLPATNIVLTGVPAGIGDTHITIKEELEESLVWSSPQFDGNKAVPPRPLSGKEGPEKWSNNEDNLLYPSPRFDQKSKSEEFSDSSVSIEGTRKQMSLDEYNRRNSGLKLESRSLDALEPQKYVVDPKLPRTRKHSRQQSISVQSWSKSEELHEKPTSSAHFERMIEENKRINAQLRCYDEALRDLAHVSVVRKQSSLSLPRAKEVSGLPRSQSAGGRNEGYFSLPSASNFAPREMATSAIVKKQGSLSLPRTSEIPDFAMMQSLGPKKQGHSSLPSTNEFGIREMAQTAIVKRQGSLSLPRTCEIPDLAAVANEEYLSLPRSNELIDEAFKEIGQSTATMKRGSRSLPRSIDAKSISLGADPVAPPRHKKSHRRRRAESEGETSSSSLKDPVRSLSLDIKRQTPKGSESSSPNVKSPEKPKSDVAIDKVETPSVESISSNGSSKEISLEKPIRKKRKMLLAMRGFLGTNRKNVNDSTVNEASVEESFDEPPFWMSTDKGGPLERQATVIERPNFSTGTKEASPSRLEAVQSEEKEEEPQQESLSKDQSSVTDETMPSNSLREEAAAHEETISPEERDVVDEILPEPLNKESPDIQRDSQSDDAESGLSHSDNTPQHVYILKGHHNLLKEHLQKATAEKSRLEETAAELGERAEKLKYELAEAKEATRSRDEVIALLEEQLTRLEEKYTKSLEEAQKYKLRLGNLEQELKHLKDMCIKNEDEKVRLTEIIRLKEMELLNLDKTVTAKDEEQKLQTMLGEKEIEQKKQEMEIHVNYLQVEKSKLTEEVNKLERKNEDLRQKLDAVVARNQLLSEEKAALCSKNSLSIKTLQEHSERWKLLYETCMDKLKLLSSAKKSVDQETQISNGTQVDKEDFKQEVQDIIHRIEEAKEKDYAIWQNKIQEDVLNAVQLLNAEYSRIESSLLKHNEKLELVIQKLLENLIASPNKQLFIEGSGNETGTAGEALKLVEELTLLNSDLKIQYQQLKVQLDKRHEELRKKSEMMKPSDVGSGEASKIEQDLRKENELLKEQLMHALNESPDKSRELWQELKAENSRLQEQLNLLVEHIKELERTGEKEDMSESEKQAKSLNRDEKSGHQDKAEDCRDSEKDSVNEMDDDFDRGQDDILDDIEDVEKQERSPYYARELFDELKNENLQLQKQLDLLVEQIREKEDFADKETSTDKESEYEELHVQNSELKTKVANLEDRMKKDMQEQQVMTDPVVWEPTQEYSDVLKSLNIENEKLKNKIQLIEENANNKLTMQNKGTMTEDQIKHEERKYKEENARLKKHISVLQNTIRQLKLDDMGEGEFGPLYEEEEYEGAGCVLDKSPPKEVLRTSPTTRPKPNYKNRFTQFQLEYAQEQLERMEEQRTAVLYENKKLQEQLNEQAKTRDMETVEKLVSEKEELEKQLTSLRSLLEKDKATVHVKDFGLSVQTMTEPDMEVVHLSMENAALQSQLKQLSKKYETKQDELEKTALLLREAREASTLLLQESRNATLHENTLLKKELDDVRQLLRSQEQNRNEPQREIQPPKVAELCNLLDHLRKENTDLQFQLKKMLSEKDKDEVDDCDGDQVAETVSTDCLVDEKAVNRNLDLALILSMGTQIKSDEIVDIPKNAQTSYIRLQDNNSAVAVIDNRHENGLAQAQHIAASEFRNTKMKEHDILTVEFSNTHHRKYSGPSTESKDCELGCTPVAVRQQITGPNPSKSSIKIQSSFKDSYSSSSETCSEMKNFQHQSMGGGSFESANSEMGNEPINRLGFRPSRDAATNTTPSAQNVELQRELQMEKERCRKYQQNVKKLKSDVQLLKGKLGDCKKPGKTDSNLALKQNNANNNNSLLPNVPSPSHYDHNMADFQRQVTELEQKVRDENSMRFSLEVQVNKMRYELQEKFQLEKELTVLRNRLEKDFVSRYELEQLRNSYEVALSRAKNEAEMAARDDLNEKLCQINSFIEKQVQEQTRLSQLRNTTESQMKQDFQETRLTLLSELAKVQASLQAKGEEEKELREKCEKLTRECEKKQEIRRKKLIEKSYNVNLAAPNSNLKEKEMNSKGYMLDIRSPLHSRPASVQPVINPISSSSVTVPVTDSWPTDHPFSHILRRELERSIRKHTRTDSLTEHPSSSGSTQRTASDEHLERLKKKYFLH